MGEWRTGLRRCNQIERIPGKTIPGVGSGLGTQPRYEALGDPRAIANIKNAMLNVGLMRLSSRQYPKVGTRQPVEDKKKGASGMKGVNTVIMPKTHSLGSLLEICGPLRYLTKF